MNDFGKGECEWYKILQLGTDGEFYGTEFGHYDMTGFGDPDVYNYYHTTFANSSNKTRITDEEYKNSKIKYTYPNSIKAPIYMDQVIGTSEIILNGKVIASSPIISKCGIVENKDKTYMDSLKFLLNNLLSIFKI